MITYVEGDLFESPAKVLVNTVNTLGTMGKGIAKDFKTIYPEMFQKYELLCKTNQFQMGQLWLYKTNHKWILNFPTKEDWRQPSKLEYIEVGLKKFVSTYADAGVTSISFPMLGCGAGGLNWEKVRPLMEKFLNDLPIDVYIHLFLKGPIEPEQRNIQEIKKRLRSG
ncbi:MAG TPA: macro domain-containing protein [Bacilli bacterium]